MSELIQTPQAVLQPYIDRLRELGVEGRIVLTISGHDFSGFFDLTGPHQRQFSMCATWAEVETRALAHVARAKAESDLMLGAIP